MSLAMSAHDRLLNLLFTGRIKPGSALRERALAEHLGISRTPVRAALARLELEGLVVRSGSRLMAIRSLSPKEVAEVFHVRSLLEGEAAALAALQTLPRDKLDFLNLEFEKLLQSDHPNAVQHWQADTLLHLMVAQAAGNSILCDLIVNARRRSQITNWTVNSTDLRESVLQCRLLLDAVVSGDPTVARSRMREHISEAARTVRQQLVPASVVPLQVGLDRQKI